MGKKDGELIQNRYKLNKQLVDNNYSIFLSTDIKLEREVVLKLIPFSDTGKEENNLFNSENKIITKLDHPNIIPLYDKLNTEDGIWIVMKYIQNGSLKEKMASGLKYEESLQILESILHALQYLHSNNIIHRDIKPSNILIDEHNHIYLCDFGISKQLDPNKTKVTAIQYSGTYSYSSPEQILSSKKVHFSSDIYSLGIVLYEMFEGSLPYGNLTEEAINGHLFRFPPKLESNEVLRNIFTKMVQKNPLKRYQSCSEILFELSKDEQVKEKISFFKKNLKKGFSFFYTDSSAEIENEDLECITNLIKERMENLSEIEYQNLIANQYPWYKVNFTEFLSKNPDIQSDIKLSDLGDLQSLREMIFDEKSFQNRISNTIYNKIKNLLAKEIKVIQENYKKELRNLFEKECDSILSKDSRYFIFPYPNEIKKEIVSIGLEDINANIKSLRSYQKNKAEWKIEILKEFKLIDYFDKKFDEFYNQYFNYRKQFLAEVIIEVSKENSIKKHNLREKMDKNLVDIDKDYKMIGSILQNPDELKNILIQIANSIIIKEKVSLKTSESESENQSEVEFSFSDFLNIIIFIAALIGGGYFFCNKSKFTSNNHKRSNPYQESNVYTDKRRENSNSYGYTKKTEKEKPKTYRDNRKYSFE